MGLHFLFQVVAFYDPLGKTAQLDCGSTYGKRQNQARTVFLTALINLGEESQGQQDLGITGAHRPGMNGTGRTTPSSLMASTFPENNQ